MCPAQDHFSFLTFFYYVYDVCPLPDPDVGSSVLVCDVVMLSIRLSTVVCAAASLFCACLVSVHFSPRYVLMLNDFCRFTSLKLHYSYHLDDSPPPL